MSGYFTIITSEFAGENVSEARFYSMDELETYFRDTFSPETETACVIQLWDSLGKMYSPEEEGMSNYSKHQKRVRQMAQSVQSAISHYQPSMDWYTCAEISAFFEEQAKKYGLIREFRENGII